MSPKRRFRSDFLEVREDVERSVYDDPQQDFENRRIEYLNRITTRNDAESIATRRGYIKRGAQNPRPAKLTKDSKHSLEGSDYLFLNADDTEIAHKAPFGYDYLNDDDINLALARLTVGGTSPIPSVLPTQERQNPSQAGFVPIPDSLRVLPPLTKPASVQILLGVVELLLPRALQKLSFRIYFHDVFTSSFCRAENDAQLVEEKGRYVFFPIESLFEVWSLHDSSNAVEISATASRIANLSLPGTEVATFGPVTLSDPSYIPRMTPESACYYARGLNLIVPEFRDKIIDRTVDLSSPTGIVPDQVFDAWSWLGLLGELATVPLGDALSRIAGKLDGDKRFQTDGTPLDKNYLTEMVSNPFVWTVQKWMPKLVFPPGWVYPPFSEEGLYWWRVLSHHLVQHVLPLADTADFHVTDLLRFSYRMRLFDPWAERSPHIPEYVVTMIRVSLLWFKYWIDEAPSADFNPDEGPDPEMTFWSENHQILFAQCAYLAGTLFSNEVFPRASANGLVTGHDQATRGRERAERWLDERLRYGFSEWYTSGYYDEDTNALLNLIDFAPDPMIATKASMVMDLVVFDMARFTCSGSFAVTAGRVYGETKFYGWGQSVGDFIELAFGTRGDYIGPGTTVLALSSYRIPSAILCIGLDRSYRDPLRPEPFMDRSRVSCRFGEPGTPDPVYAGRRAVLVGTGQLFH
jgi:hypothetical protein